MILDKTSRIIIIPDSYKGTMSSSEICQIMKSSVQKFLPELPAEKISTIPIADGGEGTVDGLLQVIGGKKNRLWVNDPLGNKIKSYYGVLNNQVIAIEMAAAAGLPLLAKPNVLEASTFGVGELIKDALEKGYRDFIIGLGGSSTNDGGAGACAALGIDFLNAQGESFVPLGKTLKEIRDIRLDHLHKGVKESRIRLMCDVNNPLCGSCGAAAVFGPQKGAGAKDIKLLDEGLENFANIIRQKLGIDIVDLPGSGAAGGMGGGFFALLNGQLERGIEVMLDTVGFDALLEDAALVFSGEGKIDAQSLSGKVVVGVAQRAKKHQVPVIAVVGDAADDIQEIYQTGVSAVVSINRVALPFEQAKKRSRSDLALCMDEIMRLLCL